jgi:O-acetyl-ADP-ribose deacetylase (regulator of RNase III)
MVGLATGDALGAPHEGGPIERLLWKLIGKTSNRHLRWTDDTQMALDLARSLLTDGCVSPDALASRFASSYRWSRGYGPGTAKVLNQIRRGKSWQTASKSVYPEGSYGNGAAMRAPVLGLYFAGINLLWRSSEHSIRASVRNAIEIARRRKYKSLALPLIGAGSGIGKSSKVQAIIEDELTKCEFDGQVRVVRYCKSPTKSDEDSRHQQTTDTNK